jgi:hypothetical protein
VKNQARVWITAVFALAIVALVHSPASAQTTTKASSTVHFEVVAVQGNTVTVKTREKGAEELTVDDSYRFTVDGNPVGVHELKPGMKGTATITTTTTYTPVVITEVKEGTVEKVAGSSVIVRTADGFKMFSQADADKRGVQIMKDGQVADLSSLREGDKLSATIVTTHPPKVMTNRQVHASLASPAMAAPAAGAASGATSGASASSAEMAPTASMGSGHTSHKKLPKTASEFPLIGVAGAALCGIALMLGFARRRVF